MKTLKFYFSTILLIISCLNLHAWRSTLYPENWTPGYTDEQGRFLHDFSYAGYMMGEVSIPKTVGEAFVDVTQEPYNADNTGVNDVTAVIQQAIDYVGRAGGGTVYLPAGTYKVKPQGNNAISITYSNIILKGAGVGKTFIRCYEENMRSKKIIYVGPASGGNWDKGEDNKTYKIAMDISEKPTQQIFLSEIGDLNVGDWIIIRSDRSADWIAEHNMQGFWNANTTLGTTFYRQITEINPTNKAIKIDIPTRYYMKKRDNARVYKVTPKITNVGLEDFSIGNKMNPATSGWGEEDYNTNSANGGYQAHSAFLIGFSYTVNSWAKNISSYQAENSSKIHMSSNGLDLNKCRSLTIDNCEFSYPQYEGGGGNGYGWNICSQECFINNCRSLSPRHAYSFKYAYSSGNVIYNFYSGDSPKYGSDFHMYLSMSNLIDNQNVDGDFIESNVRPYGGTAGNYHGHASTQTVFWNANGIAYKGNNYIVDSRQHGWGYIIGTKGKATGVKTTNTIFNTQYGNVDTAPEDFVEGVGTGASLEPHSLYYDQLSKRLNKPVCIPVFATGNDGNLPENVLDGDLNTRWSVEGKRQNLEFCFGDEPIKISGIKIAFYRGDTRKSSFDLWYSENGVNWRIIKTKLESSGLSNDLEEFTFGQTYNVKNFRIAGQGTNIDSWNSITEVEFVFAPQTGLPENYTGKQNNKNLFHLYPNPISNGSLTIDLNEKMENFNVCISDIMGREVFSKNIYTQKEQVLLDNLQLSQGMYLVTLYNDKVKKSSELLVVK